MEILVNVDQSLNQCNKVSWEGELNGSGNSSLLLQRFYRGSFLPYWECPQKLSVRDITVKWKPPAFPTGKCSFYSTLAVGVIWKLCKQSILFWQPVYRQRSNRNLFYDGFTHYVSHPPPFHWKDHKLSAEIFLDLSVLLKAILKMLAVSFNLNLLSGLLTGWKTVYILWLV